MFSYIYIFFNNMKTGAFHVINYCKYGLHLLKIKLIEEFSLVKHSCLPFLQSVGNWDEYSAPGLVMSEWFDEPNG